MKAIEKEFPVDFIGQVFPLSKSGYYAWSRRDSSEKDAKELKLLRAIGDVHRAGRKNYNRPRILRQLQAMGHGVGKQYCSQEFRLQLTQ